MPAEVEAEDEVIVFPMSFGQQRMWFLDQFQPGSPFYNIPSAIRLTGELNVAALRRALNEIVGRHEALRTTFAVVDGAPSQLIAPSLTLDAPLVDLGGLPEAEREAEALRLARRGGAAALRPLPRAAPARPAHPAHPANTSR